MVTGSHSGSPWKLRDRIPPKSRLKSWHALLIRTADLGDLPAIEEMVSDFVRGHPAENHLRPTAALKDAYFGPNPVARLLLAQRSGQIVGMIQKKRNRGCAGGAELR